MTSLSEFLDEFSFLDERDERTTLLVDLGKQLEPMNEALKSGATLVKGCQAKVWVYPTINEDRSLHFHADSTSGLTKGIIALILLTVQDRTARQILDTDIDAELAPFDVGKHLTSVRTSGLRSMIEKIRETASRYA
jgi:cysteine desulfuration protein SufE